MKYNVLKPELFKKDTKLLGKYDLWENKAMTPTHICHLKSFGTKDDKKYGTDNHFWMGFNAKNHTLEIKCDSYGGMCNFSFTKDDLKYKVLSRNDYECIKYTFELIDELIKEKIIEEKNGKNKY